MHAFLLPVLRLSTDAKEEAHVYLCEDGLLLWQTTLLMAPAATKELLDLYSNMPPLLGISIIEKTDTRVFIYCHNHFNDVSFFQIHAQNYSKTA